MTIMLDDRAFLAGLHDALGDYGREHKHDVEQRAGRTVERAQRYAARLTGEMAAEIGFESGGESGSEYVDVFARSEHSVYQEYGTSIMPAHPFMRPALAEEMER